MMKKRIHTLTERVLTAAFGRRYYAIALYRAGTGETLLSGTLHHSRESAEAHAAEISHGLTFTVAAIVTFRSRTAL